MFTKSDIDKMRNVRDYLLDQSWIDSVVERMEVAVAPPPPEEPKPIVETVKKAAKKAKKVAKKAAK
jgi:hypothetical protein